MIRLRLLAVLCSTIPLGACATMGRPLIATDSQVVPYGGRQVRIDTLAVQQAYTGGDTSRVFVVDVRDAKTGRMVHSAGVTSDGKTPLRVVVDDLGGAAIAAGGYMGAAAVVRPSAIKLVNRSASSSVSAASAAAGAYAKSH